jgi:predicted metal-dependent hydrolase
MAPSPVLDYIVVHELCHLVHLNHSKDFWNLLASILPDYQERREWLKKNGFSLDL